MGWVRSAGLIIRSSGSGENCKGVMKPGDRVSTVVQGSRIKGTVECIGKSERDGGKLALIRFDPSPESFPDASRSFVISHERFHGSWRIDKHGNGTVVTCITTSNGRCIKVRHSGDPGILLDYARSVRGYAFLSLPEGLYPDDTVKDCVDITDSPGRFDSFIAGFLDFFRRFM